jgi:hypothetical protein
MTLARWPLPPGAPGRIVEIFFVRPLGGFKLHIAFSGREFGVHDFSSMVAADGKRVAALRNPDTFARVRIGFLALVWPNGFRVGATALHDRMMAAGELCRHRGKLRSFLDN